MHPPLRPFMPSSRFCLVIRLSDKEDFCTCVCDRSEKSAFGPFRITVTLYLGDATISLKQNFSNNLADFYARNLLVPFVPDKIRPSSVRKFSNRS